MFWICAVRRNEVIWLWVYAKFQDKNNYFKGTSIKTETEARGHSWSRGIAWECQRAECQSQRIISGLWADRFGTSLGPNTPLLSFLSSELQCLLVCPFSHGRVHTLFSILKFIWWTRILLQDGSLSEYHPFLWRYFHWNLELWVLRTLCDILHLSG